MVTWAQIDLGSSQQIEAVRLYPSNRLYSPRDGFPVRFRLECSQEKSFGSRQTLFDQTLSDYPNRRDHIVEFAADGPRRVRGTVAGRYARLTVTRLRREIATVRPDQNFCNS